MLFEAPDRCVHIGDRESDVYELFCTAQKLGTHFLVRTCVDALPAMARIRSRIKWTKSSSKVCIGSRRVTTRAMTEKAVLEIRYSRLHVLPPIGKQKRYPALDLTVIHATERGAPKGRKPIDWKLITDLPVRGRAEAIEKINWYAMRWKIEMFHKVLKSGCQAEASKLRTAERLANLMAVFCIVSWRVLWLTMLARAEPDASPSVAFTENEIALLDRLVRDAGNRRAKHGTLS